MILNPKIFRAYDIRGEAFVDFDEDGFYVTAQAFGKYITQKHDIKKPKIFVSGDGRNSMPELFPAIISGLQAVNCDVVWGGVIPTPINYFALHEGSFDASIQISASHNPPQDNGLKMTDKNGAIAGDEIQEIRKLAMCFECRKTIDFGACLNNCQVKPFTSKYQEKIKSITPSQNTKKIVIDAGNGVSGIAYPKILKDFGHDVIELFCDLNPNFPNHQPDPERIENCIPAQQKVLETKADFGFVYDGDGDRVGVILSDGTILNADKIFYVLIADFLGRNPGAKIVMDAMTSQVLIEKVKQLGGIPIISKTGHSFIEQKMHEEKVLLGGEQSGHFMFGEDFYGHDDALMATLRFIQAVQNKPKLITAITNDWPILEEFSEKITVADEIKFEVLDKVVEKLKKIYPEHSTLDGIRIEFGGNEWAIIRCSNTSPKIAVRIEADDPGSLEEKKAVIMEALEGEM